ncbi:MAG: cysteine desulfurase family protein [Vicinamibacterales bacterium]
MLRVSAGARIVDVPSAPRVYFDHNATTPPLAAVIEATSAALRDTPGNASSVHGAGQRAKVAVDEARHDVARLIGARPSEVVFTSGGTEADNLAIRGVAEAAPPGRRHIVTSAIEHEAVLQTCRALTRQGWRVTVVKVDESGTIDPDAIREAMTPETALVSVMVANNEIGTLQPVSTISAIARAAGAVMHTDAVQAIGKVAVDVEALGVDLLALAAHKFNGPKGVGALWIRPGTKLVAQMTGGRQERHRRAGTENVPGIVGLGAAARAAASLAPMTRVGELRDALEDGILARVPDTIVNGDRAGRVPNTTNISFEGVDAESLLIALDLEGFEVSTGSACSSGTLEPSHVLRAMGLPPSRAQNALRFSLGTSNTPAEVDRLLDVLPAIVERARQLRRAGARR